MELQGLCLAGPSPLLSPLLPPLFLCVPPTLKLAGGFPGRRLWLRVWAPPPATPSGEGSFAETKHSPCCPASISSLSLAARLPLVVAEPETLGSGARRTDRRDPEWQRSHSSEAVAPL